MAIGMRHIRGIAGWLILPALLAISAPAPADVVAVVSAKSTITRLSRNQVADIFLGKTARFPDGSQAVPIDQSEGAAVRDEFYSEVAGKSPAQVKAHWSKIIFTGRGQPPQAVASSSDAKRLVVANSHTIGYIDSRMVDETVRVVTLTP